MKKTCLILTTVLFGYTANAQTDVQNSLLRFPSGGNPTPTYIQEGWGLNISGTNVQPVKVINTSLMVGYTSANQDFGVGNLLINGRVGVGTQSPQAKLHVQGGGMVIGTNAVVADNNGSLSIGSIADNYTPNTGNWTTSGSTMLLSGLDYTTIGFHDSGERVDFIRSGHGTMQLGYDGGWGNANIGLPNGIWNSSGNVGIGTTNPFGQFTVMSPGIPDAGNAYYLSWFIRPTAQNWGIVVGYDTGGFGTIQSSGANSGVQLKYNNAGVNYTGLTLSSQGSVGIGTASPDPAYKLSVNGNIRGKEVRVETGWSDYVFKKDYRLKTLPEVEAYIAKQGHLPDVPSEAEVRKNGVNVGETESLLLKKIEELTLYLIEKDKEVKDLKLKLAQNEGLGERLSRLELLLESPKAKN